MHVYGEIIGTLSEQGTLQATLTDSVNVSATMTIPTTADVPRYDGAYNFTPSQETQTVSIDHLLAMQDITIEPIPSNYGLITWNGSTITVS